MYTSTTISTLLLGGLLVALGVVADAVADRIRYGKRNRQATPEMRMVTRKSSQRSYPVHSGEAATLATAELARQVCQVLTTAGYKRSDASAAVWSCNASECATLESWTRAALQKATQCQRTEEHA